MSPPCPHRFAVKLFVSPAPEAGFDLEPAIGLFHRFIQEASLPGLLLDVADYAHVPEGPGVILIGHDVDYGLDEVGGRLGLLVTRKRDEELDLEGLARDTLRRALAAAQAIEADGGLGLRFDGSAPLLMAIDRLTHPNDAEAAKELEEALRPVLEKLYPEGARVERAHEDDPRKVLALQVRADGGAPSGELVERLGG